MWVALFLNRFMAHLLLLGYSLLLLLLLLLLPSPVAAALPQEPLTGPATYLARASGDGGGCSSAGGKHGCGIPPSGSERQCPVSCFRADPVCGADGITYWCGHIDAECAGAEVAHSGFCSLPHSAGSTGVGLLSAQALLLVHTIWLISLALFIFAGLA